jgi:Lipase (class 3)
LSNLAFQKEQVYSKTDGSKSCTVGEPMLQSYYNMLDVEDQIDVDCVSQGLPLIFTGHSQGAALAQLAAVRYEQQQPNVINFGPMAAFFDNDECPTIPDERIINFVNTETDKNTRSVFQFDIVPFLDKYLANAQFASFWTSFLPENIYNTIVDAQQSNSRLARFFIGTFKGEFYILNPDDLPSVAYVSRRDDILLNANGEDNDYSILDIDLLDLDEILNFSSTTFGQRFASAHEMNNYQRKLQQLLDDSIIDPDATTRDVGVAAIGFEPFTSCNPNAGWKQCVGFCAEDAMRCSTGAQGEPCFNSKDCIDDLSCTWTLEEGTFQLTWQCL